MDSVGQFLLKLRTACINLHFIWDGGVLGLYLLIHCILYVKYLLDCVLDLSLDAYFHGKDFHDEHAIVSNKAIKWLTRELEY